MNVSTAVLAESLFTRFGLETKSHLADGTSLDLAGIRPLATGLQGIDDLRDDILYVSPGAPGSLSTLEELPAHLAIAVSSEMDPDTVMQEALSLDEASPVDVLVARVQGNDPTAILTDRLMQAKEWFDSWDERLLDSIVQREHEDRVLSIAAEALSNPVALFDSSSALVSYAGRLTGDYSSTIWSDVISKGYTPMTYYTKEERDSLIRQFLDHDKVALIRPRRDASHENATAVITVADSPYAYLSQVDLMEPFTCAQQSLLLHVRDRFQEMAVASVGAKHHKKPLEHCARLLLAGDNVEGNVVRFHLRQRGWKLDDHYHVIACPVPESSSASFYLGRIASALPRALVIEFETCIVCILDGRDGEDVLPDDLHGLRSATEGIDLIGISSSFDDFMTLRSHYRQALDVIELGRRRSLDGMMAFDDLFMSHVRQLLDGSDVLEELGDPHLLHVLRNAGDDQRDNVHALYVYLLSGCNFSKAAKRLYMHRNTLEYRIDRMSEALGIEFSTLDADQTFRMVLTCLLFCEDAGQDDGSPEA